MPGTLHLGAAGSDQGHGIVAWREEAFLHRFGDAEQLKETVREMQRRIYAA